MDGITKKVLVYQLGGKCICCGYNKCLGALHFHHINPTTKEFDISSKTKWKDIDSEIDKCVLLCSNCHSELHNGLINKDTIIRLFKSR